jgi:ribonuclease P protein component
MPDNAPVAKSPYFLVKMAPTKFPGDARYGLVTTKRTFKLATSRNRARRLIRAWMNEIPGNEMNPEMDYVFILRTGILTATKNEGVQAVQKALKILTND